MPVFSPTCRIPVLPASHVGNAGSIPAGTTSRHIFIRSKYPAYVFAGPRHCGGRLSDLTLVIPAEAEIVYMFLIEGIIPGSLTGSRNFRCRYTFYFSQAVFKPLSYRLWLHYCHSIPIRINEAGSCRYFGLI